MPYPPAGEVHDRAVAHIDAIRRGVTGPLVSDIGREDWYTSGRYGCAGPGLVAERRGSRPSIRSRRQQLPIVVVSGESTRPTSHVRMLEENGFEVRMVGDERFSGGLTGDGEVIEVLRGASAVIAHGERYSEVVLENLPDLRVVARNGVGFDKVDVAAATANDVVVTITPTANHQAVAEHALALIMGLAKFLVSADKETRGGEWKRGQRKPLRGSTLGIAGLGRIGKSLAVRALGLKMQVIAAELYPDEAFVKQHGIELVDLDTLLQRADFVSIHMPLSDETSGIIDAGKLGLMKPTAYIVNTARGGLIVEADLDQALRSGQIAGAGIDVFEQEPTDPKNPLYELDNVIVSPHVAGIDDVSSREMGIEAAQSIIDLSQGRWPEGAVINDGLKGKWRW